MLQRGKANERINALLARESELSTEVETLKEELHRAKEGWRAAEVGWDASKAELERISTSLSNMQVTGCALHATAVIMRSISIALD